MGNNVNSVTDIECGACSGCGEPLPEREGAIAFSFGVAHVECSDAWYLEDPVPDLRTPAQFEAFRAYIAGDDDWDPDDLTGYYDGRPTRLVTRGGSWTTDRTEWLLTVTTDRRFEVEGDGTRVAATIETQLAQPLRRPLQAVRNWLYRGAAQREFEHQLALIAKRIEAQRLA